MNRRFWPLAGHVSGEQFGVRLGRWKLIHGPDEGRLELFDLERDPGEHTNVAEQEPAHAAELRGLLEQWRAEADVALRVWREAAGPPSSTHELDEAERARLEALGYVE